MTGNSLLQVVLSAALFLALWKFLSPIISEFVEIVIARKDRTERSEDEVFHERAELKELTRELEAKRQEQRARGVKIREEIVETAKAKTVAAADEARRDAVSELNQFRDELNSLRSKLEREIETESEALSNVIIEKVSAGSGLNAQTVH